MTLRLLCCVLLCAPLVTWAAPVRGIDSYARGDYEKAISALRQEVENPALSDKERARARTYLAASLYARGLMDDAREQLEELARQLRQRHEVRREARRVHLLRGVPPRQLLELLARICLLYTSDAADE